MAEAIIKAIAPWFGGKRTMAADVIAELGPHTQYFEPFCGSLAIILAKSPAQKETVNDLHGDAMLLARVVAHPRSAPVLYERLQVAVMSEGLLDDARMRLADPIDGEPDPADEASIERSYWYFVGCWMGRNGTAGTDRQDYQIAVRWTKNGGSPTVRFRNAVASIPAWHARLLNVVILQRDAFTIVDKFEDCVETAIYVDPPYPRETRSKFGDGRGGKYLHEFAHESSLRQADDHARLAAALRAYQHDRIVVSTYDCQRYRELFEGWTFIDKTRQKHLHSLGGRGSRPMDAPEVLIVNGPSFTGGGPPS